MKPDRVFRILPSRSSPAVILPRGSTVPAMRLLPRPGRGGRSRIVIIVRPLARGNHEPDRWLTALDSSDGYALSGGPLPSEGETSWAKGRHPEPFGFAQGRLCRRMPD